MCVKCVCQYLEENPKATGDEIEQVLKEFTDTVIEEDTEGSENIKPVSTHLYTSTKICSHIDPQINTHTHTHRLFIMI